MGGFSSPIFPKNLHGRVGCAATPLIIDVGCAGDFAAATAMIVGVVRRRPDPVGASQTTVSWMRSRCHASMSSRHFWSWAVFVDQGSAK